MKYPIALKPVESEKTLISSIVWDADSRGRVFDTISTADLTSHQFRRCFEMLQNMHESGEPIDLASFVDKFRSQHKDLSVSELVESLESPIHNAHETAIKSVQIASERRKVYLFGRSVMEYSEDVPLSELHEQVVAEAVSLSNLAASMKKEDNKLSSMLDTFHSDMDARESEDLFKTGIRSIDEIIMGIRRKQYIVLCGRPSQGKTSLAFNILLYLSLKKIAVSIISLETDRLTIESWLLSILSSVPLKDIKKRQLATEDVERIDHAITRLKSADIYVSDSYDMNITAMRNEIRRMKLDFPELAVVMIDHFQLMHGDGGKNRNNELGEISRMIKQICKEFNICVLLISQFNRAIEYEGRTIPQLSDIRETGDVEQDADIIIAFHYKDLSENVRMIRILKNKEGESNVDISLKFKRACLRYS
jgi:replicative DNA helicase